MEEQQQHDVFNQPGGRIFRPNRAHVVMVGSEIKVQKRDADVTYHQGVSRQALELSYEPVRGRGSKYQGESR